MKTLDHRFVENIPEVIEEGIIYVSIPYETVIHKCCCGCGNEVVTPLSPTDWSLTFDGESISLDPSIGNWSIKCQSHYYIIKNKVKWSIQYSDNDIRRVRRIDVEDKHKYFNQPIKEKEIPVSKSKKTIWERIISIWSK